MNNEEILANYESLSYDELVKILSDNSISEDKNKEPKKDDWTNEEKEKFKFKASEFSKDTSYSEKSRKKNEVLMKEKFVKTAAKTVNKTSQSLNLSCFTSLPAYEESTIYDQPIESLISKVHDKNLPIFKKRLEIVHAIKESRITIITGKTGTGKSTQVPQYILDSCKKDEFVKIIVSQPRKIAAITIAEHVAFQRNCQVGGEVGYQVGLHREIDLDVEDESKILFCTTGVILNKLARDKTLAKYSHIILDEVHERDLNTDLLLAFIHRMMIDSSETKLILMSATIDEEKFKNYFTFSEIIIPKIISCGEQRRYNITTYYLDNFVTGEKEKHELITSIPSISYQLYLKGKEVVTTCLKQIDSLIKEGKANTATILVFLPGLYEIETMYSVFMQNLDSIKEQLDSEKNYYFENMDILVLHSTLSPEHQRRCFDKSTKIKIILATNIAESSITLPNVTHVIDFCLTKVLKKNPGSNITSLVLEWAAKQNCAQRSGRCGRLIDGNVVRMVPKKFYEGSIQKYAEPEIKQTGLESPILKIKVLNIASPIDILSLTMDPPYYSAITDAIIHLKELGGLMKYDQNGKFNKEDGDITYLGRIMDALPLDCHLTKLIVLGHIFKVFDDSLIIAAGLSLKSIFALSFVKHIENYVKKLEWAVGSESDSIAILNAYVQWSIVHKNNSIEVEKKWCKDNSLDRRNLHEMRLMIEDLKRRLIDLRLKPINSIKWTANEYDIVLKSVIAAAFGASNFFIMDDGETGDSEASRLVGDHDIFRTVFLTGMPEMDVPQIYDKSIKEILVDRNIVDDEMNVSCKFDGQKIFIIFKNIEMPTNNTTNYSFGRVALEVYKAVKLRTVLRIFPLNLASDESSKSFASYFKIGKYNGEGKLEYNAKYIKYPGRVFLPTRTTTQMYGYISHFKENGNFFFQTHHAKHGDFKDSRYVELSQQLDSLMQSIQLKSFNNPIDQFDINKMVVMIINDRKVRAKIVKVRPLTVYIIDEGKCFEVKYTNSIKDFASKEEKEKVMDFPPQCFECRMMGIQPSLGDSANRNWAPETIKMLSALANQKATLIIHSVVGDVAAVDLISQKECWNDVLLVQGKAEECEEPHANKLNLSIRRHVQNGENVIPPEEEFKGKIDGEVVITKSLPKRVCTISANLKGPFSPLETKLRGLTQITSQNSSVANTSVNHILLNDEILDKKKKVYVAANITTSKSSMGTSFQVHETSLIPQINGLSTIIAMIFSPMVQIRRDDKKKKFVSILCGLGFDLKSKESLYPQHDVAIDMDVKMSPQDIQKINSMRVNISKLLYTSPKDEFPALNDNEKNKIIDEINAIFQQIITKKFQKDSNILPKDPFKWNVDQTDAFLEYHSPADASILPTINIPKIEFSNHQEDNELKKHALELENIANRNSNHRERICRFCNFKWDNNIELSFHLTTPRHMKKVQSLLKQI